jgi:Spy/CpxP family protein refolding chaperone
MKTNMFNIKPLLITGSSVFLLVLVAQAHPMSGNNSKHYGNGVMSSEHGEDHLMLEDKLGGPAPWFLRGINLTDAQQDNIFKILYAQAPTMREKMKNIRNAMKSLHTLVLSGQYNEAEAKSLAKSIADDLAAMLLIRAQGDQQIYGLLTQDQRKQLESMKTDREFQPTDSPGRKSSEMFRRI